MFRTVDKPSQQGERQTIEPQHLFEAESGRLRKPRGHQRMILQVSTHRREVVHHLYVKRPQLLLRTDSRQHQQLGEVEGAATQDHLLRQRLVQRALGDARLRLGMKAPAVFVRIRGWVPDDRHPNRQIGIFAARLQQQHACTWIFAEPCGQCTARRTRAHNDIVVFIHGRLSFNVDRSHHSKYPPLRESGFHLHKDSQKPNTDQAQAYFRRATR